MDGSADSFDVVAVVGRAAVMELSTATVADLGWADRAADRVRQWVDAWQATVHHEQTLPRPLPPIEPSRGDASGGPGSPEDAAGGAGGRGGGSGSGDAREPTGSASGDASGAAGSLPSLGAGWVGQESAVERERKARRAWLLSRLSGFAAALSAGRITTGHVDTLAAAADRLPSAVCDRLLAEGAALLQAASGMSPERFSRVVHRHITLAYEAEGVDRAAALRRRSSLRRGVDDATKMHWLQIQLDPERGVELFGRLDAEREAIFHSGAAAGLTRDQVELQALLNLVRPADVPAAVRTQRSSTKKVHALVLIDVATLLGDAHDRTVCENAAGVPLPPEVVRRLICQADVTYGLTLNGRVVASVTNNDLATPDQRRELRMMYRTCVHPDCTVPFDRCQIHHVVFRSRAGPTDIAWMVPLCTTGHDLVHHGGWTLAIDPDRTLTWTNPHGHTTVTPFVPLTELDRPPPHLDQPTLFHHDPTAPAA